MSEWFATEDKYCELIDRLLAAGTSAPQLLLDAQNLKRVIDMIASKQIIAGGRVMISVRVPAYWSHAGFKVIGDSVIVQ